MEAVQAGLDEAIDRHGKFVSGFGHRFHPIDPRAPRLLQLVDEAAALQVVSGKFAAWRPRWPDARTDAESR